MFFFLLLLLAPALFGSGIDKEAAAIKSLFAKKSSMDQEFVDGYNVPIEEVVMVTDSQGLPTLDAIKQLMEKDFFKVSEHKDVVVFKVEGGSFSDAIYSINVKGREHPVFFLKISKKDNAFKRLIEIQKSRIGRIGLEKHYNNSKPVFRRFLPTIVWLEKVYRYKVKGKESDGFKGIMELSHAAQGEEVSNIIYTKSLDQIETCGYFVGKALGSFQQVFIEYNDKENPRTWLTVAHYDFHEGNVFFDIKTKKVYFIDNETMQAKGSVFNDVDYMNNRMMNFIRFYYDNEEKELEALSFMFSFLKGYLEAYPADQRYAIGSILIEGLLNKMSSRLRFFDFFSLRSSIDSYRAFLNQYIGFLKSNILGLSKNIAEDYNKFGATSLFWAIEKNDSEMLALLERQKIDVLQETQLFPRGVLEYFILTDNDTALKNFIIFMKPAKEFLELTLTKAAFFGSIKTVKYLLNIGVNVNVQSRIERGVVKNVRPLWCSVSRAHSAVVQELLGTKGIEVNFLDFAKRSLLLLLASKVDSFSKTDKDNADKIAQMLINAGADVSLKNENKETVFDIMPAWESYEELIPTHPAKVKEISK